MCFFFFFFFPAQLLLWFADSSVVVARGRGCLLFCCGMWLLFLWWSAPLKLCLGWLLLGILWSCIRGLGAHLELLPHALALTCMPSHILTHTCTLLHVLACPLHALTHPQMSLHTLATKQKPVHIATREEPLHQNSSGGLPQLERSSKSPNATREESCTTTREVQQ